MGVKGSWFRRRPSDDEMREELEAHVAMRAEHDRVDEAAARRRLGNLLQTRESMRRVWIAEWWDALRQDAHFTWRSWRRQPGVRAGGHPRAGARPRRLDRAVRGARPRALQAAAVRGSRSPRLRRAVITVPARVRGSDRDDVDRFYVQVWDTTAGAVRIGDGDGTSPVSDARSPKNSRRACGAAPSSTTFFACWACASPLGRDFAPEDDVRGAPPVALISHGLWVRRYGADPGVVETDAESRQSGTSLPAGPASSASCRPDFEMPVEAADILLPAQMRPLDPNPPVPHAR